MLPGQRLSACTCPGESHPGPVYSNGSFVGRSSPEIDLLEALIDGNRGQVSQSAQWAPFNVCLSAQVSSAHSRYLSIMGLGSICMGQQLEQHIYSGPDGDQAKYLRWRCVLLERSD